MRVWNLAAHVGALDHVTIVAVVGTFLATIFAAFFVAATANVLALHFIGHIATHVRPLVHATIAFFAFCITFVILVSLMSTRAAIISDLRDRAAVNAGGRAACRRRGARFAFLFFVPATNHECCHQSGNNRNILKHFVSPIVFLGGKMMGGRPRSGTSPVRAWNAANQSQTNFRNYREKVNGYL